jgi:voltage-dependent calcium channel T type alpha-1G
MKGRYDDFDDVMNYFDVVMNYFDVPGMRILVMLLLDTLPMLGNVLLLCFFVFFIFGIIGVQLWEGILRQRCFLKPIPNVTYPK